jgi:protein TonB
MGKPALDGSGNYRVFGQPDAVQECMDPDPETLMSTIPPRNDSPDQDKDNQPLAHQAAGWRPSRRTLLLAGLAFGIGLLLFALLWWRDRGNDFYHAEGAPQAAEGQQFEPLPTPLPASESASNASGMGEPDSAANIPTPRVVEAPPAPPPPPRPPAPPTAANGVPFAPGNTPVPLESPAPDYPPEALRNGESGTVLVRVHVGADGVPYAVDLVQSSRSRSLDRAASDAVKRWRFHPAQRDGQPVAGEVQVPIAFNADR